MWPKAEVSNLSQTIPHGERPGPQRARALQAPRAGGEMGPLRASPLHLPLLTGLCLLYLGASGEWAAPTPKFLPGPPTALCVVPKWLRLHCWALACVQPDLV